MSDGEEHSAASPDNPQQSVPLPPPRPYSDQAHLNKSQNRKPSGQKRDSHFVCFPLVTGSSSPQLAVSLERFRRVTTITPEVARRRRLRQGRQGNVNGEVDEGHAGECATPAREEAGSEDLQILPAAAHRPPGTFHLTIGTMDLSEKSEMARAVRVLKRLDLRSLMADVEREVGFSRSSRGRSVSESTERRQQAGEEQRRDDNRQEESGVGGHSTVEKAVGTIEGTVESLTRSISPPPLRTASPSRSVTSLSISLAGLSAFAYPRNARVFYAPPQDPSDRLLLLANKIRNAFKAEGFVTEKRELTLHATVANMRYANTRGKMGGRGGKGVQRMETVDGRALVAWFGAGGGWNRHQDGDNQVEEEEAENGYIWAKDIVVDRVRICKMGAEKSSDPVLGMVYPAITTEDGEVAEVVFSGR